MSTVLTITAPPQFSYRRTLYSHGWCALPPFQLARNTHTLRFPLALDGHPTVSCSVSGSDARLRVTLEGGELSPSLNERIQKTVRVMFRLDEEFGDFYRTLRMSPEHRWIARVRAGRMLRAPTVFEDIVKMICTTNCTWALTTVIVTNLCRLLGSRTTHGDGAFPTPGQLAGTSEKFLRTHVRAGYRSPYLLAVSRAVAAGSLDVEAFRTSTLSTDALYRRLLDIPGVGPYAAQSLLKLMGRYDYLGLDSWVRAKYAELHHRGRRVSDRTIERRYDRFGEWKGLVCWLEMTRHWFDDKFPI